MVLLFINFKENAIYYKLSNIHYSLTAAVTKMEEFYFSKSAN